MSLLAAQNLQKEEELREQEEAYQSALADPQQAHLFNLPTEEPGTLPQQVNPDPVSPMTSQPETENQPQLRRSARISELANKMTKHYTPKKSRIKKLPQGKLTPRSVDKAHKALILEALSEERLNANPLEQSVAHEIDSICGLRDASVLPIKRATNRNLATDLDWVGGNNLEGDANLAELMENNNQQADAVLAEVEGNANMEGDKEGESVLIAFEFDSEDDLSEEEDCV